MTDVVMQEELRSLRREVQRLRALVVRMYELHRAGKDIDRADDEYEAVCGDERGEWR